MIKCVLNNTRTVLFYLLITKLKRNVIAVIASISSADSKAVICSKSRKTKKILFTVYTGEKVRTPKTRYP